MQQLPQESGLEPNNNESPVGKTYWTNKTDRELSVKLGVDIQDVDNDYDISKVIGADYKIVTNGEGINIRLILHARNRSQGLRACDIYASKKGADVSTLNKANAGFIQEYL